MATTSDDNCAVGPDGKLLDASEISWSFDPDATVVPPASWSPTVSSSTPPKSKNAFDVLLSKGRNPASSISGQRRSTRERRPTEKVLESSKSTSKGKRKASPEPRRRVVVRKISNTPAESIANADTGDSGSENETEVVTEAESNKGSDDDDHPLTMDYNELKELETDIVVPTIPKSARTRDVYVIFEKTTNYVNPDTNATQNGHICGICRKKKIPMRSCFLSGSVTSLRKHIARNKDHFAVYKEQCEKHDIPLNATAVPKGSNELSRQSTLDNVIVRRPNVEFSVAGLIDYMIQMIVLEDKAIRLVTRPSFQRLLQFCRPSLRDKDFVSDRTLQTEILKRADDICGLIKERLMTTPSKVSITFDLWTSDPSDPYMSITGHYIWAPADCPTEWDLKSEQLSFAPFSASSDSSSIIQILSVLGLLLFLCCLHVLFLLHPPLPLPRPRPPRLFELLEFSA
ncbi:hypothetical protein K435DRAFT_877197 [Dendrothele bispora CBS 962.96]|uniref:BED-type domain-containing protein n=1 Tax=Dendrothele bispora (strain CBS 962.96) TaxID=1314807 RepID=A0A4S8KQM0_DENBC|nr:hypothetical protein K435DRAFT_877197 [Dendrothele bispora CBS 962.96]